MHYARIAVDHEDVPAGALVTVLKRINGITVFSHEGKRYEANLSDKSLLVFPSRDRLLEMLVGVSPRMGIHYHAASKKFMLVNFDFGHFVLDEVPVFKGSKVKGKRQVATTKHISVSGRSFDYVVYHTFYATLSGKLKNMSLKEGWRTLVYNKSTESFIITKD